MSKHPIPQWLREQFSKIEDEVRELGPCGVFTQMRTVTQTYFEQAAAPQPPALGGEPEVFGMVYGQRVIRLTDHRAHLAPLQAEIERLKSAAETLARMGYTDNGGELWKPPLGKKPDFDLVDQLKARCDEQAKALSTLINVARTVNRNAASATRVPDDDEPQYRQRKEWIDYLLETCAEAEALSKPAGSEQAPPLEIPSRTITLSGCAFTEDELLRRAVRAVRGKRRNTYPRWALVRDAFGCGSGVGTALCRRFGFDPEEIMKS